MPEIVQVKSPFQGITFHVCCERATVTMLLLLPDTKYRDKGWFWCFVLVSQAILQ